MATKKKLLQAAAGAAGAGLNVEDVFSTYLYEGTGSGFTITNGVDLTEGGLVWMKRRDSARDHALYDTERGVGRYLRTHLNNAQDADNGTAGVRSFNSDGFTLGANDTGENDSGGDYVSWTFRKAPKFFDVVTYAGDSVAGRTISHNLGSVPGMIIIKNLDVAVPWAVYHRSMGDGVGGGADENYYMNLNYIYARAASSTYWNNTAPTSTTVTLGASNRVNATGSNYVAYLFAHNDGDGEFGPDGDADIIKCGSVSGSSSAQTVDLGFEPQFILYKRADDTAPWRLHDVMRGMPVGNNDAYLEANASSAEADYNIFSPTPTGFRIDYSVPYYNTSGGTYIYIAIRRGPMAVPESASDVFDISVTNYSANQTIVANIDVTDTFMVGRRATNSGGGNGLFLFSRLTNNNRLRTDLTFAENPEIGLSGFDTQYGVVTGSSDSNESVWNTNSVPSYIKYFMKRAPNYFDVVCYTGNGTAGRTVSHNLGVAPEMMWVKFRSGGTSNANWTVYHAGTPVTRAQILLNLSNAASADNVFNWNNTSPTSTEFTLGAGGQVNANNDNYIAYLFASLAGVSKVGSYTGDGTTGRVIDCGFSSGARFVLIKRTDSTGDWYFWDTERGIVSGNDPHLSLNTNAAEVTTDDSIDPVSSGFAVNQVSATNINVSSAEYIFYAIA